MKEQKVQNDWQKEISNVVENVYNSGPMFKVDTGKSIREILKGDHDFSKEGLARGALILGLKEMGLSQEETIQILSQLSDKPIFPATLG